MGAQPARVAVIGSINRDTTMEVDRLPSSGETVLARATRGSLGGKGANQAVAARRQGIVTALVGAVGNDASGTDAVRVLREEFLDVDAVRRVDGVATGEAHIAVDRRGANTVIVSAGANAVLSASDIAAAAGTIERAAVVLAQLEVSEAAVVAAFIAARKVGALTILNPAPARPLSSTLLELCDLVVPNEHEAAILSGEAEPGAALSSLMGRASAATVIVTCGENGAWVGGARVPAPTHVDAFAVTAVDSVAAGDAFCGVLAASLAEGHPLFGALRRAAAAGAHAVTIAGALPSLPTAADVDRILRT